MELTHWKKLENPDYIGSYAFQPGEEKTVTIKGWSRRDVTSPDSKTKEHTIISFVENEKPLVLNAGNAKMISKLAGSSYVEHWVGLRIVLGVERIKAFGQMVDAVRVLDKKVAAKPNLCTDCRQPIKGNGKLTGAQIAAGAKKKFGVELCAECGRRRKEAAEHAEADSEEFLQRTGE